MIIRLTDDEIKEAIEKYLITKLQLEYHPKNLRFCYMDHNNQYQRISHVEIVV